MPVLSHLYHLFNAEQCQAYIHTLRWQDRPLQCPRCQSHHIGPWGTYQYRPGCKRYWCHGCKRTFNDLTATLLHQSQRSLSHWILATFLLCLVEVSPKNALSYHCIPTPRDTIARLLRSADITLPKAFSLSGTHVSTKKKLPSERLSL